MRTDSDAATWTVRQPADRFTTGFDFDPSDTQRVLAVSGRL
jgi:hypothetical protein